MPSSTGPKHRSSPQNLSAPRSALNAHTGAPIPTTNLGEMETSAESSGEKVSMPDQVENSSRRAQALSPRHDLESLHAPPSGQGSVEHPVIGGPKPHLESVTQQEAQPHSSEPHSSSYGPYLPSSSFPELIPSIASSSALNLRNEDRETYEHLFNKKLRLKIYKIEEEIADTRREIYECGPQDGEKERELQKKEGQLKREEKRLNMIKAERQVEREARTELGIELPDI